MALEKGFFPIYNTGTPLRFAVDIKPNYAGIAVFETEDGDVTDLKGQSIQETTWAEFEPFLSTPPYEAFGEGVPLDENKAGALDLYANGTYVKGFPGCDDGALYKGRSYIFSDGMTGLDEIVDYSILDIMTDNSGFPTVWRNRLAQTKNEKISTSFRWRAVTNSSNALVVFMPFDTGSFEDCRIELLCDENPVLLNGTKITGRIDDETIPNDGLYYTKWFYHVKASNTSVLPDGTVEIPFTIVWANDDTPVNRSAKYNLNADAGYLPKARVVTDDSGSGTIKFTALGLEPGDVAHIKVSTEHFTNLGKITVHIT